MTRQMADDEVLRVLDRAARLMTLAGGCHPCDKQMVEARAAVAALQAERDAWRALSGQIVTDWIPANAQLAERAERAESALEALRGQVAGLVEKWQAESNALPTLSHKGAGLDRGIKELSELLAIKERMG